MTARESILEAIATLLSTVPGAAFFRSREAAMGRSEGTAILLKPEEESLELRAAGMDLTVRTLTIVVTVIARDDVPDQLADPVIQALHAAIMRDRTLGGLCALIFEHSTKWDFEVADMTGAAIEIRYSIRYQTRAADMSSPV